MFDSSGGARVLTAERFRRGGCTGLSLKSMVYILGRSRLPKAGTITLTHLSRSRLNFTSNSTLCFHDHWQHVKEVFAGRLYRCKYSPILAYEHRVFELSCNNKSRERVAFCC
jgi:hypothetical protein